MPKARRSDSAQSKSLKPTSPDMKPVGILGGGQLARMMALKAHEMGVPVAIYSENKNDPAAQVVSNWHGGKPKDDSRLKFFLAGCSVVTFESEFLDADLLAKLSRETGVGVFPKPSDMSALQDRWTQKRLLLDHGLPTADFVKIETEQDAKNAFEDFGAQVVFKKRRFGYDGYGTYVVRSKKELLKFLPEITKNENGFIAERFVKFRREIAVMAGRSANGDLVILPFVETHQENSRCLWAKGPLQNSPQMSAIIPKVRRFLNKIGYVGMMGIEFFDTANGYFVNEIAPRVHNSGHYTLDAMSDDQFSLHLKAVLGMRLGQPRLLAKGFAMMNLLGSSSRKPSWILSGDAKLHWYGKSENRPGRKMGHINTVGQTSADALKKAVKNRAFFDV